MATSRCGQRTIGSLTAQLVEGPSKPGIIPLLNATGGPRLSQRFQKLTELMAALRAPQGCPWDRKQTHESLKPYLLEEAYEVLEAIDHTGTARLREELG